MSGMTTASEGMAPPPPTLDCRAHFCLISDSGCDKMSQKTSFRSCFDSFQSRNLWKCELPHLFFPGNESESVNFAFFDTPPDRDPRRMNHEGPVPPPGSGPDREVTGILFGSAHERWRAIRILLEAVAGTTFAEAERMCLDVRRLSALAGSDRLRDSDLHDVTDRSRYRRDVLRQAQSGGSAPAIDREADAA